MDFEFSSRSSRLQKEQERRKGEARRRAEKEKEERRRAREAQQDVERLNKERRLEQARLEEEARRIEERERERTGGIRFCERFSPVAAQGDEDKILLPPSALQALSEQDAISLGPLLFELALHLDSSDNNDATSIPTTHGGVLEFSAREGTVGLPRKVWRSLMLDGEGKEKGESLASAKSLQVKYVRLPKAEFARFVPVTAGLSQVPDLKIMMEQNLQFHATLSTGDVVEVWHRGKLFEARVAGLRPAEAVTILNADVELELDLPEEAQKANQEKAAQDRARTLAGSSHSLAAPPLPVTGSANVGILQNENSRGAGDRDSSNSDNDEDEEEALERMRAALQEEPEVGEGVVTCLVRSRGTRLTRRFRTQDRLSSVFDWLLVAHEGQLGAEGRVPQLVIPYPRRVVTWAGDGSKTFAELGIVSKQETFMLEIVDASAVSG